MSTDSGRERHAERAHHAGESKAARVESNLLSPQTGLRPESIPTTTGWGVTPRRLRLTGTAGEANLPLYGFPGRLSDNPHSQTSMLNEGAIA